MSTFVHRHRVRYHECDAQGHVFNAHYVTFADVAITELWRAALGSYQAMLDMGADVVTAEVGVRFRAPARFDEELDVGLEIVRLGRTGITTTMTMRVGERTCATGELRHVVVGVGTVAPSPMPPELRSALAPWATADADAG